MSLRNLPETEKSGSKRKRGAMIVLGFIAGTALVGGTVYAGLTATTFNTTPHSVGVGTLKLTQAPSGVAGLTGGFSTAITLMAPGDTINRYIDLTNGGTLDAYQTTLKVADGATTTLTTDATNGLQVTVKMCTVAYTTGTGACSGTETTPMAATPANTLLSMQSLSGLLTAAGAVDHLKFVLALPAGSEVTTNGTLPGGTVQGVTSTLTWTFVETERPATSTNS